jgi:hypothetical protein
LRRRRNNSGTTALIPSRDMSAMYGRGEELMYKTRKKSAVMFGISVHGSEYQSTGKVEAADEPNVDLYEHK